MNQEMIEAVADSQQTMLESVECLCGGVRQPIQQSLSFDKEIGGMVDVWTMLCSSCKQKFEVKVPLERCCVQPAGRIFCQRGFLMERIVVHEFDYMVTVSVPPLEMCHEAG